MIHLDGSSGEGGGQIVRTALAASMCTGQAFTMSRVRAGRKKPGLLRQHLTCVRAAARVSSASVSGDELGSTDLVFRPQHVSAGTYELDIGSAGSTSLVAQTVLFPLLGAEHTTRLTIRGGTHNPMAPPFEFLELAFGRALARLGGRVRLRCAKQGFYPAGGGELVVDIDPSSLAPAAFVDRGGHVSTWARAVTTATLGPSIAGREAGVLVEELGLSRTVARIERSDADGPGNVVFVVCEHEHVTEVFSGLGAPGIRAERVASEVARDVRTYLASDACVGEHLADQLLLPLVLAGGGELRTGALSLHAKTQIDTLRRFFDVGIAVHEDGGLVRVVVG